MSSNTENASSEIKASILEDLLYLLKNDFGLSRSDICWFDRDLGHAKPVKSF